MGSNFFELSSTSLNLYNIELPFCVNYGVVLSHQFNYENCLSVRLEINTKHISISKVFTRGVNLSISIESFVCSKIPEPYLELGSI